MRCSVRPWLVVKTEGSLREPAAYRLSWLLLIAMLGGDHRGEHRKRRSLHVQYAQRWFAWPNIILTAPVPICGRRCHSTTAPRASMNKSDYPALFSIACTVCAPPTAGLAVSIYPFIVPQKHHDLAGGRAGEQPDLLAVRRLGAAPADPRL